MLKSLRSAFLMYSRIPVPKVDWNEENRRYALCFFPLIGAVIGAILLFWRWLCFRLNIGRMLFAVVSVWFPVLITGGIHLDGFCDVTDAKFSYASRERKLEIMSDSHVGAFAVMYLGIYLLLQTGFYTEVDSVKTAGLVGCGFVLSRALSGLSAVLFKSAKKQGALQSFVLPAHRNITIIMLSMIIILSCIGMMLISPAQGICCAVISGAIFWYYRRFAYQTFGGITGDTAGWFLQICELSILGMAVLSEKIMEAFQL
ncbi:MAG: adenosylcobinamide-GDP ribazoletransferase [Ruminococcus sp.]|nr:adenosylcobinamide-GDP ribazoletransferase [Ruminococcus sp.]